MLLLHHDPLQATVDAKLRGVSIQGIQLPVVLGFTDAQQTRLCKRVQTGRRERQHAFSAAHLDADYGERRFERNRRCGTGRWWAWSCQGPADLRYPSLD